MKYIISILFLFLFGPLAHAQDCQNFKDSGDGIPAAYFHHKCEGEKALRIGQYDKAVAEFEKALSIEFHESPNYELNVELSEALCKLGKKDKAFDVIQEFKCMAAVDLGELSCEDNESNPNPKLSKKCYDKMCIMAIGLTSKGRKELLTRQAKMKEIEEGCR